MQTLVDSNQRDPFLATPMKESGVLDLILFVRQRWLTIFVGTLIAGGVGFAGASLLTPIYTARTVVMPPQQQQNAAAAALSSLGALAGLAGGSVKSPVDQYIALMQSVTVSDRIIEQFKLMEVYDEKYRVDARKELLKRAVISAGKKDGLLVVEVDDSNPKRAADIANAYIDELRQMTNSLALSEAQQRRKFFEQKLEETKSLLSQAQIGLQTSGFNAGALRAEPKAAAEGYARIKAEITASEVRLQSMKSVLADSAPEVKQQQAQLDVLRTELGKLEKRETTINEQDVGYVSRYRNFKYQETLFELYAKQFELARLDESREGALIQVIDSATPPEKKSKPKRSLIAVGAASLMGLILMSRAIFLGFRQQAQKNRL